jgi:signal recognition particle subunit SRP54
MFDSLSGKFNAVFKKLKGRGSLTEKNIEEGLKEVRMALLEADVNYKVVKSFVTDIRKRSLGKEVMESLTPGQQVVKIVNEELTLLMGENRAPLNTSGKPPAAVMLAGLQGAGKTTTAGKLSLYLRKEGKKPFLVPADVYRPAAVDQLQKIGAQISIPVFSPEPGMDPVDICIQAMSRCAADDLDVMIIDTAGRLHVDEALMDELVRIKKAVKPSDILFVADAMTGQDAVKSAASFDKALDIGGVILTKMDGDARGGAAMSIKAVTGKPIKFIGSGEKLKDLEPFHPDRMASRILGMGDVLTLIERAQESVDEKTAADLEKKIRKNQFTLEDFRDQLGRVRKMGSLTETLGMIPGLGNNKALKNLKIDENGMARTEAIINSMTPLERQRHTLINGSRRKRIAKGSGVRIQEVNKVLKNYSNLLKMLKKINKGGMRGIPRNMLPF